MRFINQSEINKNTKPRWVFTNFRKTQGCFERKRYRNKCERLVSEEEAASTLQPPWAAPMVSSNDQTILFSELKRKVDLCPEQRFGGWLFLVFVIWSNVMITGRGERTAEGSEQCWCRANSCRWEKSSFGPKVTFIHVNTDEYYEYHELWLLGWRTPDL